MKTLAPLLLGLAATLAASAQTMTPYDDFSASTLDSGRWAAINEDGSALASASTVGGGLTVTGAPYRSGFASFARIGQKGVVQAEADGWSGTNQILQLYCGPTGFNHWLEFGMEGTDADGTPILHVWFPGPNNYSGRSPVPGAVSPSNPTTLRIERNGNNYTFLANGAVVYTLNSDSLNDDARVMLYGWNNSVSRWDDVSMSGPSASITAPAPNAFISGSVNVHGFVGPSATSWALEVGAGLAPATWTQLASGVTPGVINAPWSLDASAAGGTYTLRLSATDAGGYRRAFWAPVTLARPTIVQPFEGQIVGPAYTVVLGLTDPFVHAKYLDNGAPFAEGGAPFTARRVFPAGSDGPHAISAVLTAADGSTASTPSVNITVNRDLYGRNARVADDGRAFVFPDGSVTVAIGENDGYDWPGLTGLFRNGDVASADAYVAMLKANGVNVMRIMMEYAENPVQYMETPLGTWAPLNQRFWDQFLPICEKYGMTVLATPWDTFWMNRNWDPNPYNAVNPGGLVTNMTDFITSPAVRASQKNRFKYLIDRYGNSRAIFAWDLLNEFDIWWNASEAQRQDWVNEMAAYVQDYEYAKWGHRHMVTVSTAASEPGGIIGDVALRHPRFEFANTHQYYGGTVNNPQNIIAPAISVNGGVKANLAAIADGRPYTDSESGPIDLPYPWLTNNPTFDTQYFHHMAWAHLASGGAGGGMRWPYLDPHYLTMAMHAVQKAQAAVCKGLDWSTFHVANADNRVSSSRAGLITMASADARQAMMWVTEDVRSSAAQTITGVTLTVSGMAEGQYVLTCWNTNTGAVLSTAAGRPVNGSLRIGLPSLTLDMAVTVRPALPGDASGDGKLTSLDAYLALRDAAGMRKPSAAEAAAADFNADGVLDVADVAQILQAIAP
ncbi:MAG TPA: dockerin type I repeat-containing protein [Armatimonadota bacterium]|jgi:mannan endo-1,4-beta-mannosidase